MKKPKYNVKIDVCDNGALVSIKSKDIHLVKVFEGKSYVDRYSKWIESVCSQSNEKTEEK